MSKSQYLIRSIFKYYTSKKSMSCNNCGSNSSQEIDRKYFFTRLQRCNNCKLQYRTPTDNEEFNKRFYNLHYKEGKTTEYPTDKELMNLLASGFSGSEQNYSRYIQLLQRHSLKPGSKIFDFGCSWGYGSYQFSEYGYDVKSYEIGEDRRNYGIDKLNIDHINDPYLIAKGHPLYNTFDCFFSAHVLEHVPAPSKVIELAWNCLRPGGLFIAITPNGSSAYRSKFPNEWHKLWGEVHPNFLDEVFYDKHFSNSTRLYESPVGRDVWSDYELGFIAVKEVDGHGF